MAAVLCQDPGGRHLLTGLTVAGDGLCQQDPLPPLPKPGLSTRKDPKLKDRVEQITKEVLGDKAGF